MLLLRPTHSRCLSNTCSYKRRELIDASYMALCRAAALLAAVPDPAPWSRLRQSCRCCCAKHHTLWHSPSSLSKLRSWIHFRRRGACTTTTITSTTRPKMHPSSVEEGCDRLAPLHISNNFTLHHPKTRQDSAAVSHPLPNPIRNVPPFESALILVCTVEVPDRGPVVSVDRSPLSPALGFLLPFCDPSSQLIRQAHVFHGL